MRRIVPKLHLLLVSVVVLQSWTHQDSEVQIVQLLLYGKH